MMISQHEINEMVGYLMLFAAIGGGVVVGLAVAAKKLWERFNK